MWKISSKFGILEILQLNFMCVCVCVCLRFARREKCVTMYEYSFCFLDKTSDVSLQTRVVSSETSENSFLSCYRNDTCGMQGRNNISCERLRRRQRRLRRNSCRYPFEQTKIISNRSGFYFVLYSFSDFPTTTNILLTLRK